MKPITPDVLDRAVRAGLISNAEITDADKPLICNTIGASFDGYELIEEFEFDATRLTERRAEPDGTPYHFKHLFVEMYMAAGTKNTVSTFRAGHTSYSNCCRANIPYGFDTIARYSCVWVDYVNGFYRIQHSSGIGSSSQASYGSLYNNIPFETDRDIQYIRLSEEASAASSGNIMRIWAVRS